MSDLESDYEDLDDSDVELQDAFSKGQLKPGVNTVQTVVKKEFKNNVPELKRKISEFKLSLGWIERLDLINGPAQMAPELASKLSEQERLRENQLRNVRKGQPVTDLESDPVLNDFRREMAFYRQAQAAVMLGIPKLKELGIPTKRPDDYFAEMAKSDEHMHKVREALQQKQHAQERSEKAKKQRQLKKLGKKMQVEARLKRESEKKKLMEEVKKYRKGIRTDLDFLEDNKKGKANSSKQEVSKKKGHENKRINSKRKFKDKKFGFGGKKRGIKSNTKESSVDTGDYRKFNKKLGKKGKQQRPGKSKRIKMKSKKRNH